MAVVAVEVEVAVEVVAEAEVGTAAEAIVETAAVATTAVPIPVRDPAAATRDRQHRKPLW